MTSQKNTGLWLCSKQEATGLNRLVATFAATAACVMLLLAMANLIDFPGSVLPMVLTGGILCVICGYLKYLQKGVLFYMAVLVALVALVLLTGSAVKNGVGLLWNSLAQARTAATGKMVPEVQTRAETGLTALLPVSILLGGIAALLCSAFSDNGRPVLVVGLPALLLTGMAVFHKEGEFLYILPVLAVSVLLLLTGGASRSLRCSGVLWSLLMTAVLLLSAFFASSSTGVQNWAAEISGRVHKVVHSRMFETDYSTLPEGDFRSFEPAGETAHPALAVTMEVPESLYLRGFTGANLEDGYWKPIDSGTLAENKELLYWLNTNEFYLQAQFSAAAEELELDVNPVTVQNVGACSRYRYIPFTLCPDHSTEAENLSPDSLLQTGERLDSFRVLTHGAEQMPQVLEALQNEKSETVLGYRKAESAYRDFVYQQYLQVSPEVLKILQPQWDQIAEKYGGAEKMDALQAQACVRDFLQKCFSEESVVELPLPQAAGTDYQYATVTVFTLRYFGIPARYAEGYRITDVMAAQAEPNEPIQVDSSCATAWAEVYQDGIGWIPMALTQGMKTQGGSQGDQTDENSDASFTELKEGQELEETPENPVQDPEPQGGSSVEVRTVIRWGFLLILLAAVVLLALCWIRRKRILKKRMACFNLPDRSQATAWIFSHTALLLEKMGYRRGNGSMQAIREDLEAAFGDEYARRFMAMNSLNERAMFSSHPLEESQWQAMLAFYETTLQQMKEKVDLFRRIWLQWILCLF